MAMQVSVNGTEAEVPAEVTIRELLDIVEVPPNYLAVEVNEDVVPRDQHPTYRLSAGDRVEVVTLVGGG